MSFSTELYRERPTRFRRAMACLYGAAVSHRLKQYRSGRSLSGRLNARVISLGNLTVGGTGKTPTAIYTARALTEKGIRTAILSRGYKGRSKEAINIVSDGQRLLLGPRRAGDEAVLMARSLPGAVVLTGPDRLILGQFAIDRLNVQALVLDDGFQHLKIERDINLLLLDAEKPWGNGYLIPAGSLREPRQEAERATAFLITRADDRAEELQEELAHDFPDRPIFLARHRPVRWMELNGKEQREPDRMAGREVLAFCGLAQPQYFYNTLVELGLDPVGFVGWPDHFRARPGDLRYLAAKARSLGLDTAVTTAKDAVKLAGRNLEEMGLDLKIWVLEVGLEIKEREDEFQAMILGGPGVDESSA